MNEPFTFRPSDCEDPHRGEKFDAVLHKRAANPTDVLRGLLDAYIESDGAIPFPVRLEPAHRKIKSLRFGDGRHHTAIMLFAVADQAMQSLM